MFTSIKCHSYVNKIVLKKFVVNYQTCNFIFHKIVIACYGIPYMNELAINYTLFSNEVVLLS